MLCERALLPDQAVKMLARLHHRLGQPGKAMETLEAHMAQHALSTDLTHINILAELYMEAGRYAETVALIQRSEGELCPVDGLPIDLTVRPSSFFPRKNATGSCLPFPLPFLSTCFLRMHEEAQPSVLAQLLSIALMSSQGRAACMHGRLDGGSMHCQTTHACSVA
jgi:hypothetical protein